MNFLIILNKGRLQAVNMPKEPALCFKRKDKCEFEGTDWGGCLCEKYYREYDKNLEKAKSEAIDFRPEDYRITGNAVEIKVTGTASLVGIYLTKGETYPVPGGYDVEIIEKCKTRDCCDCGEYCINPEKYARLVPIKEQKKEEPSELRQLIWRVVVDTFNSKSNNCSDIYNKIIKEEKDIIELLEQ